MLKQACGSRLESSFEQVGAAEKVTLLQPSGADVHGTEALFVTSQGLSIE
jgi:hypothetical protein